MKKGNSAGLVFGMVVVVLTAILVASNLCGAQEWSRKGKSEVFGLGQFMKSDVAGSNGVDLELDSNVAGGFGFGYNFNDHLNLNVDLNFGRKDVEGRSFFITVTDTANVVGSNLNLDFYVLKSGLTPMVTGGIGFINFSGDFGRSDFNETDFSYNVGGGFRWDVSKHLFIKAIYRGIWTKLKDTDSSVFLGGPAVSIGYIF